MRTICRAAATMALLVILAACDVALLHPLATEETMVSDPALAGRWYGESEDSRYYITIRQQHDSTYEVLLAIVPFNAEPEEEESLAFATRLSASLVEIGGHRFADFALSPQNERGVAQRLGPWVLPVNQFVRVERDGDELRFWYFAPGAEEPLEGLSTSRPPVHRGLRPERLITSDASELQAFLATRGDDERLFDAGPVLGRHQAGQRRWFAEPPNPYAADAVQVADGDFEAVHQALRKNLNRIGLEAFTDHEQLIDRAAQTVATAVFGSPRQMDELLTSYGGSAIAPPMEGDQPLGEFYPAHLLVGEGDSIERLDLNPGNAGPVGNYRRFIQGWVRWSPGTPTHTFAAFEELPPQSPVAIVAVPGTAPLGTRAVLVVQFIHTEQGGWLPHSSQVVSLRTADDQPTFEFEPLF